MKIDRLIGILSILQKGGQVTAPELAERFEVSRRTITRDIEDLCRAGIPIVTMRGAGGGISLMPGNLLDTSILTEDDLRLLFSGLETLDSVSSQSRTKTLSGKLTRDGSVYAGEHEISIDLASFYRGSRTEKIELLSRAIRERRMVSFRYYYEKGERDFRAEPYRLLFRWSDWYLLAWQPEREDFRLYKLQRMWNLECLDVSFTPRALPPEELDTGSRISDEYHTAGIYAPEAKYRLIEEYGPHSFRELPDGRLYFEVGFRNQVKAVEWFLGFGDQAEAIEPPELRAELLRILRNILTKYSEEQDS